MKKFFLAEEYFSSGVLRKLFSRHAFFPRHYSLFTFLYQTGKSFLENMGVKIATTSGQFPVLYSSAVKKVIY